MATLPGKDAQFDIDPGQSGSFDTVSVATDSSISLPQEMYDAAQYGDEGQRRIAGRVDASISLDVNFDMQDAQVQALMDAAKDGSLVDVEIYPDGGASAKITVTGARVSDFSPDFAGDSQNTASFTLDLASGTAWSYTT